MAITHPNLAYLSGASFDLAVAVSNPIFSAPFDDVNVDYMLEQDYMCLLDDFLPLELNSVHPDYGSAPAYYLTREGPKRDITGGVVRWTRTYCRIPEPRDEPGATSYAFIAYLSSLGVFGRPSFTQAVPARIRYDYFLLDKVSGDILDSNAVAVYSGTPGVLPSVYNIPVIAAQEYFDPSINAVKLGVVLPEISYGPDAATPQTAYPTPDLTSAQPPYAAYPTREEYESWVDGSQTVETYDPVTNVLTDTGLNEIVAVASQSRTWQGNICERVTTYIKPI